MFRYWLAAIVLLCVSCSAPGTQGSAPDSNPSLATALNELDRLEQPTGVGQPVWDELTAELSRELKASAAAGIKFASAPPVDDRSRMPLTLEGTTLSWRYFCTGDYNQDGLVAVTDITPIGQRYNQAWAWDPTTAVSVIDGDQNGMITVSDITPIGQNYNRSVASYNIYGSSVLDDYPVNAGDPSGGATLLGTVAFDTALGEPTDRKHFAYDMLAVSYVYFWVRPVDGDGNEGIASEYVEGGSVGPPTFESDPQWLDVVGSPGDGMAGPVLVDDAPAMILISDDDGSRSLVYLRGTDRDGTSFSPAVTLAPVATGWPDLAVVDGNPAVAYCRDGNRDLEFRRADDAQGASWPVDPVVIDSTYHNAGMFCSMLVVDGNPAVAFTGESGGDEGILLYSRATDAQGTAWGAPIELDPGYGDGDEVLRLDFALVDGNPAVFYQYRNFNSSTAGLRFVRATDATGSAWGTPVTIDTWADDFSGDSRNLSLVDLNGIPGVSWYWESWGVSADCIAYYCQSGDSTGSVWSSPMAISPEYVEGQVLKFSSLQTFATKDGEQMAALVCDYPTDLEGIAHSSVFVTRVGAAGGVDWSTAVQMDLDLDTNTGGTSTVRGDRTASCFGSMDYISMIIAFLAFAVTTSDVGDTGSYHCYGFSAGMNGATVEGVFVHLELPESTF